MPQLLHLGVTQRLCGGEFFLIFQHSLTPGKANSHRQTVTQAGDTCQYFADFVRICQPILKFVFPQQCKS